jgi:hypothetical protein
MESSEELQQQEITVLESIYGDDFQICQSTTAWKVRGLSLPYMTFV